VGYKMSLPPA